MKLLKNTVLAAACIVLALAPAAASTESNSVRMHVRSYEQKDVEDSTDSYDSADSTDSYDSTDSTDSYDSTDSTDSYDATDSTDSYDSNDSTESYDSTDSYESVDENVKGFTKLSCPGGSPMSVQGVAGVFCVYGDACSGNTYGNCPDAQPGLEQGAYCGTVTGGALGCKISADGAHRHHKSVYNPAHAPASGGQVYNPAHAPASGGQVYNPAHAPPSGYNPAHSHGKLSCPGGSPMSVQGVAGVFCVYGDACSGNTYGNCPDAQPGLEQGAYCGTVTGGALGCKISADGAHRHHKSVYNPAHAPASGGQVYNPAHAPPSGYNPAHSHGKLSCPGGTPMSVEGVAGVFCVYGDACSGDNIGNCPDAQPGLEQGAYCGTVSTGVWGCKISADGAHRHHKSVYNPAHAPASGGQVYNPAHAPASGGQVYNPAHAPPSGYNPAHSHGKLSCPGGTPMSVEGVAGVFCVYGDACSGDNIGNCPDAQPGLEQGAYCGTVSTGVWGCKISADGARLRRHHKHHRGQQN